MGNFLDSLRSRLRPRGGFRCNTGRLYLVTGADRTHAKTLLQFLDSAARIEPNTRVVAYDLGLTEEQRTSVLRRLGNGSLERLPYERFPAFFDIRINAGEYAWKPAIVAMEMAKSASPLCWMDAGNVIVRPLRRLRAIIRTRGFYCSASPGTIAGFTHPTTLERLSAAAESIGARPMLAACCIGFDPAHQRTREVAAEWNRLALDKDTPGPIGPVHPCLSVGFDRHAVADPQGV